MTIVHKSVLLNYSAEQIYALVENMENYPSFLPWCDSVDVYRDDVNHTATATISLNFCGIRQSFTTKNTNRPNQSITMKLLDGPFRQLDGQWTFTAIDDGHCRVELDLTYEFSHFLLGKLVGPVFDVISNSMVDSFREQADKTYG